MGYASLSKVQNIIWNLFEEIRDEIIIGKTILIVGGGIGGLTTAGELRRLLPDKHRVVLIEKNPRPACPRWQPHSRV
jgi:heterodisulfide reductase subunit A-like polyferredoxin